jgi:NAD+ kinase
MQPIEKLAILPNTRKAGASHLLAEAVIWLEEQDVEVLLGKEGAKLISRSDLYSADDKWWLGADMVMALGGDGTVLKAVGLVSDDSLPVLGINMGTLGFLTDVAVDGIYPTLERVLKGDYTIERRMALQAEVVRDGKEVIKLYALNDIVVATGAFSRVIRLLTRVSGVEVSEYSADGMIVSTPTGSTAYTLASGGPVVHPSVETIIIAPICPHTLAVRPVIVSAREEVTIEVVSDAGNVMLTADGQRGCDLAPDARIVVRKAANDAKLVRTSEASFYDLLRTKMNWG